MYTSFPYMMPSFGMQAASPVTSSVANIGNLGNAASAVKTAGTSIFSKINFGSILSNTQKTLNVVNQAIPLYYQVKPVFKNIRALSKIGKEFTKIGDSTSTDFTTTPSAENNNLQVNEVVQNAEEITREVPEPTFFL